MSITGLPFIGIKGLGSIFATGPNRVPNPPAINTTLELITLVFLPFFFKKFIEKYYLFYFFLLTNY